MANDRYNSNVCRHENVKETDFWRQLFESGLSYKTIFLCILVRGAKGY